MSFDRVAPHYRCLETLIFGDQLQQARAAFVGEIESPRRILIVGEGDGRFLAEFVKAHPDAAVDCIEASGRMIELAHTRIADERRVSFIQADLREVSLEADCYDLIVTSFFLDCFAGSALREVMQKLIRAAKVRGCWLLADFRIPRCGWRRWHAQFWIRAMYLFFRLTTGLEAQQLDDPSLFLLAAGFERVRERLACFRMIKSELWCRSA